MSSVVRGGGLVSYSDSSPGESDEEQSAASESESEGDPPRKKQCRGRGEGDLGRRNAPATSASSSTAQKLPLPSDIIEMFNKGDESDELDDGLKHGGRVRSFAHVRGNWATYVYIPFLFDDRLLCCIRTFHKHLRTTFPPQEFHTMPTTFPPPEFHTMPLEELHISLSRTVAIRHHCIEPLVEALRTRLRPRNRFFCGFYTLALYCNEEKTRSFIGLEVSHGYEQLCSLVKEVDKCFAQYRLQEFYSDPSFHVSIFWCLGDILPIITDKHRAQLQKQWEQVLSDHQLSGTECYDVTEIRCKTGNKIFSFPLTTQ